MRRQEDEQESPRGTSAAWFPAPGYPRAVAPRLHHAYRWDWFKKIGFLFISCVVLSYTCARCLFLTQCCGLREFLHRWRFHSIWSTVLVYEDCPELTTAARALANDSSVSLSTIAFRCGAATVPSTVLSQMTSLATSHDTVFFVVMATTNVSIPPIDGYPNTFGRIIHLPARNPRNLEALTEEGSCTHLLDPMTHALSLTSSWMLYRAWTQVTVLYDQTLFAHSSRSTGEGKPQETVHTYTGQTEWDNDFTHNIFR